MVPSSKHLHRPVAMPLFPILFLASLIVQALASITLQQAKGALPYFLILNYGNRSVAINDGVFVGRTNTTLTAASTDGFGQISNNDTSGTISAKLITPTIARVEVNTSANFIGASFHIAQDEKVYGLWEYPWGGSLHNRNISFDLKGVGNGEGINWNNARAPFFLSSYGYGVYTDTLSMGSYDFKSITERGRFVFNSSNLVYYIILSQTGPTNIKSILSQYMELSARIEMPPDSAYGPTFWSDDFEQDFHGSVSNAQENYYDVVDHLFHNQIHATSMFADRPYGTGNMSYGNFDFDPKFYPDPKGFIANLTSWGYDFQVWVANRAFLDTELYRTAKSNQWLFPNIDPDKFLGPALDLTIRDAYVWMRESLKKFTALGVNGFKIDRGEEGEMPDSQQNIQMTLFEKLTNELMIETWGKGNFYNFARSAVDRSRQYTGVWNGDAHADWTGLRYSVASGIRAGLLGFSMWGSDTGGYNRQPQYNLTEELWARWMHFSAFSPVYEIMIGTGNTPWYEPYSPRLVSVLKTTTDLHHRLLPFIKSYTYRATKDGIPLMRALFLEMAHDVKGHDIADEYYFGSEFLVAPIVKAGGRRSVYFPEGTNYLEYFNKTEVYQGGSARDVEHGLDSAPVFVRAGAIVPTGDIYQGNNKWTKDWKPSLVVELYPSFDVLGSRFRYFNGKTEAIITMLNDPTFGTVFLEWDDLGIDGQFSLYSKSGVGTATIEAGKNGSATFESVESLFGK
jgi:alpha-D-xyloside xylohydrolase